MTDTVQIWDGAREVTRFHRDGTRTSFTLPFAPLATQISTHVFAVDARGATHRFSLDGVHEGFVPLLVDIAPRAAALSRDGSKLAVLEDRVRFFAHGVEHPWSFRHRRGSDWRESGVGLSGDGECVRVDYSLHDLHGLALGDRLEGVEIVRADGATHFRYEQQQMPRYDVVMSHDARRIAYQLHDAYVHVMEGVSMRELFRVEPKGKPHVMRWFGERLAILFDYELVIAGEDVKRIALPEHFTDVVLVEDDAVCVHPELGAWWIKTAATAT